MSSFEDIASSALNAPALPRYISSDARRIAQQIAAGEVQTELAAFLAFDGTLERSRANLLELKGGHARVVLDAIQHFRALSLAALGGS